MVLGLEVRKNDILKATAALLISGGLSAVTTRALAAHAQCSKTTIYALFPDKHALLAALITDQAEELANSLSPGLDGNPLKQLQKVASTLIDVLLSDISIAINRAAAADQSGKLGVLLHANGRDRLAPKIGALALSALDLEDRALSPEDVFQTLYGLLLGDRQVAALLGLAHSPPDEKARLAIANRAISQLQRIYGA
jgi:AcrR family transcriptional regulator